MKIYRHKIFYSVVFAIYLGSIGTHQFFHNHEEDHDNSASSNRLHTHLLDQSLNNDLANNIEFHVDENDYFNQDHIVTGYYFQSFTTSISIIIETNELNSIENSSFVACQNQHNTNFSKDKYVFTETNLPPPLS